MWFWVDWCCADAEKSATNETSATNSEQKSNEAGQTDNSDPANAAGVQAKVESVEDHKNLKCLGMTNVLEVKYCIH